MKKEAILLACALVLTLTIVSANSAPRIEELDEEIILCESTALSLIFNATDIDGDILTTGISPSGPFFAKPISSDIPITQIEIFSGNLTKEQANKVYEKTIFISDGIFVDSKEITFTVLETNNPPKIENPGVQTISLEDSTTQYKKVLAIDIESGNQDSGNITFNITSPLGLNLTIDEFGTIVFSAESSSIGSHEIEVCAIDSGVENIDQKIGFCGQGLPASTCKTFSLLVVETNTAPTISFSNSSNPDPTVIGTDATTFEVFKFDPEEVIPDALWYVDNILKEIDSGNVKDKFTYSFGCGVGGKHTIKVKVTDGLLSDTVSWNLDIVEVACPEGLASSEKIGGLFCEEKWGCYDWGICQNAASSLESGVLPNTDYQQIQQQCSENNWPEEVCGLQVRSCSDTNDCMAQNEKPLEISACYFSFQPSCSDNLQNCHEDECEFLADCGGPCEPCSACSDGIKNHGEEEVDCGGPCFEQCPGKILSSSEKRVKQIIILVVLLLLIVVVVQSTRLVLSRNKLGENKMEEINHANLK